MNTSQPRPERALGPRGAGSFFLALQFSATLLVSATLLFVIQPMVGKMILPALGGTPGVWNTCMVFFQAVLLAGYAYAHLMAAWLPTGRQVVLHVLLLAAPLLVLPIDVATGAAPPVSSNPAGWLLLRLTLTVGPPLFFVSSTAPLLQQWFARTRHPHARDPYFLYAASNAGSLIALLSYPLLVEPGLRLSHQSRAWTGGYVLLVVLVLICGILSRRNDASSAPGGDGDGATTEEGERRDAIVTAGRRLRWVLLAMAPSSLLLGVTTHITTNIAAVPLLWVVPLALYFATYMLVFARRNPLPHRWMVGLLPFVVLTLGALIFFESPGLSWLAVPPHLVMFFVVAMVCHGELARSRPDTRHLTEFYLWMSVGGVLGGLINAIVAPLIFDSILEYPLMLVVSCFLIPNTAPGKTTRRDRQLDVVLPLMLAVVLGIIVLATRGQTLEGSRLPAAIMIAIGAMACYWFKERPVRFGLGTAAFLAAVGAQTLVPSRLLLLSERNFFGVKRVVADEDGRVHRFIHGTTNHGSQWTDPAWSHEPTAYYHREGPIGDVFTAAYTKGDVYEIAVVGLGAGGLAAYATETQNFTFFEIDPEVEAIAMEPRYFTYLAECRGTFEVVLGDGRRALAAEPDGKFDLIILDAFSSDAVPTHLLTIEALDMYLRKLSEGGFLVFNITNAYLDFRPVMGNLSHKAGLVCLHRNDNVISEAWREQGRLEAHFVVMARKMEDLGTVAEAPGWTPLPASPRAALWTDQFCDIVHLFRDPRSVTSGVE